MNKKVQLDCAWKFNVLNVYNYTQLHGTYYPLVEFIRDKGRFLEGDILEAGTFKGRLTAGLATLLREIGSSKIIHTYDTFEGFPGYSEKDDYQEFSRQYESGLITEKHWEAINQFFEIRESILKTTVNVKNISSSMDFSENSLDFVIEKFNLLGLENVIIHQGKFEETMTASEKGPNKLFLTIVDCDLYDGYSTTLPYVWPITVPGGMIFLDEYYSLKFPGPRYAVNEFLSGIKDFEMTNIARKDDDFERWAIIKK
jgi:hypothetical protein